jgi:hypothetical protein
MSAAGTAMGLAMAAIPVIAHSLQRVDIAQITRKSPLPA